jgi:Domain of unknown function (DUF1707)
MARASSLRASDADRDAVAERLRQAAVEGRLDPDELEQRLHIALRARTYGDLNRLLTDLPAQPVRWQQPRRGVGPAAGFALVLALRLTVALIVLAGIVIVAAATLAWWMIGLVVWLALSSRHSCRSSRRSAPGWHRPPHVRRV